MTLLCGGVMCVFEVLWDFFYYHAALKYLTN